jgi:hypothetical protein
MSAKDYRIYPALFNAYIAKVSKRNPNMMTKDRREITEGEIMGLIHWWIKDKSKGKAGYVQTITLGGKRIVEIKYLGDDDNI